MKEVFKEIWQAMDKKVALVTLLSIAFIALMAISLICSLRQERNDQPESNIENSNLKYLKQTLLHD